MCNGYNITILCLFYYKWINYFIDKETLMLLDECMLSNDNNRDQKKQHVTSKQNF